MILKNNIKIKLGFSLLELSVVLLVISVLMTAVIKGSDLIDVAKINSAKQKTINSPVLDIDNLIVWYEPIMSESFDNLEADDGKTVSVWNDISGNNPKSPNNALQTNAANRPTYKSGVINDLPLLRFDGLASPNGDYMETILPSNINSDQLEVFVVGNQRVAQTSASMIVLDGNGVGDDYSNKKYVVIGSENSSTLILTRRYINLSTINPHPGNFPHILSTSFDGQFNTLYFNGDAQTPVESIGNFDISRILIGARYYGGILRTFYNGDIAEIIIFNRALNNQERLDVLSYLSSKYDITLQ